MTSVSIFVDYGGVFEDFLYQQVAEVASLPPQGFIVIGTSFVFRGVFAIESVDNGYITTTNHLNSAFVFLSRDDAEKYSEGDRWQVFSLKSLHKEIDRQNCKEG